MDLETTGIGPMDRVVEIAVVRFAGDGSSFDQWATLVQPGRDLGVAHIHGVLSFQDLRHAPRFEDIAGDLVARLQGCVLVAHNAQFEERFLGYEFRHLGLTIPQVPTVCTLRLGCSLGATSRRLIELCRQFGIPLPNAHSALSDANATARLLSMYSVLLRGLGRASLELVGCTTPHPPVERWPQIPTSGMTFDRYASESLPEHEAPVAVVEPLLSRAVARLVAGDSEEEAEYLDLLDRVVADHQLTMEEFVALRSFAQESGFAETRQAELHRAYFDALVRVVWEDGLLTATERDEVELVGRLLGIDSAAVSKAVAAASGPGPPEVPGSDGLQQRWGLGDKSTVDDW